MPPVIQTTTLLELERAVIDLLHAQGPTHVDGTDYRWSHFSDNRKLAPSMVPRGFVVQFSDAFEVQGGLTGAADIESGIHLSIVADYRAVREEVIGTVLFTDREDLHDWLSQRLHPAITGLMWVGEGRVFSVGEEVQRRYSFDFPIHYQRAIRSP